MRSNRDSFTAYSQHDDADEQVAFDLSDTRDVEGFSLFGEKFVKNR